MLAMAGGPNPSGLKFSVLGFPVTVTPMFLLMGALIGFSGETDIPRLLLYLAVVGPSILAHELGHAVLARRTGAQPRIVIHGFGGYATYAPPRPLGRAEQILISLAGPGAGALLGLVVLVAWTVLDDQAWPLLSHTLGDGPFVRFSTNDQLVREGLRTAVWINLGWGLVNLLPMLPLDGGHVLEQVMPGDRVERRRLALYITMPVAALVVLYFAANGQSFLAIFFALFAAGSLSELRSLRPASPKEQATTELLRRAYRGDLASLAQLEGALPTLPGDVQDAAKTVLVEATARSGNPARARRQLDQLPGRVPRAVYAYVSAWEGQTGEASEVLAEMLQQDGSPSTARYLLLVEVLAGRAMTVPERYIDLPASARDPDALREAAHLAFVEGHFSASARIGQFLVDSLDSRRPDDARNVSTALAQAGLANEAATWEDRAVALGWVSPTADR